MAQKNLSIKQIMNRIYQDIDGFEIPKNDEKTIRQSHGSPIYGEISHHSLSKLLSYLKLKRDDVLIDLGSGVGKVILQTALTTKIKSCIGVELSKTRYLDALKAKKNSLPYDAAIDRRAVFINDNMLNVDLSHATVIYTCSTAFSDKFMKKMVAYLASFRQNFCLVSLQELSNSKHFTHVDTIKLNMSWVRNTPVYIYKRNLNFN